jgi:uncharacterized protein (UPF0332 family)
MKEVESLMARAEKYLRSAGLLLREEDYESCVSRAYYAMLYAAEAALLTKGLTFSSHRGVVAGFGEQFVISGVMPREMGKALHRAFEKRQLSDYEYTFVITREEADEILQEAQQFVGAIHDYLKGLEISRQESLT